MIDNKSIETLVDFVRQAAREEIMPRFKSLSESDVQTKSSTEDFVTEADISAEKHIVAELSCVFPNTMFVREEAGLSGQEMQSRLLLAFWAFPFVSIL